MLSFTGTWIQNTGQQWLVYELTHSEKALGLLTFISAAPMFILSPLGGYLADRFDKRIVLVLCSGFYALSAFTLAISVWIGVISFSLIAGLAFMNGCVAVIEIPTRLSMISHIVKPEDLGSAIPLNSMTFNSARVIGPVIGGVLLQKFGPELCYLVNGISFGAIIIAVLAIRADLRSNAEQSAPLRETLFEGINYVRKRKDFLVIVTMVITTSFCGMFYISQISALAKSVLRVQESAYALLFTATGVGALLGLLLLATLSRYGKKGMLVIFSMIGLGMGLIGLASVAVPWQAMIFLGFIGAFGIMQLVGSNTILQSYSPPHLRGRVISVHVWSLAGMHPLGALLFGYLSEIYGLSLSFYIGGVVIFVYGSFVLMFAKNVREIA